MKVLKSDLPELTLKYRTTDNKKVKVSSSDDAFSLLQNLYDADILEYCEVAIVLFLNRNNETIGWIKLSQGGMSGTVVDNKIIFATALQCGASSIILSHNHPSGNLQPSKADCCSTDTAVEVGKFLALPILDHLIITRNNYFSFADEGLL